MTGKEHGIEPESADLSLEELYQRYRKYSFAIAYRMLGTVTDAEDVVQDCFVELRNKPLKNLQNPKAYVAKMTMNRCLNLLNSARKQRETYVGQWLPEPLGESADLPADWLERKDMISYAFLVLLEQLKPMERAVFVLRKLFNMTIKRSRNYWERPKVTVVSCSVAPAVFLLPRNLPMLIRLAAVR